MNKETNTIDWFEIPVTNMSRARHFYQVAFSIHMEDMDMPGMEMVGFPYEMGNGKVSGALLKSENNKPSPEGALIYFNADPDMTGVLNRIASEGGQVILGKTLISPEIGYMALFCRYRRKQVRTAFPGINNSHWIFKTLFYKGGCFIFIC
jgi:predicted enzyme related to lactoylglutathione lyase